MVMIRYIGLLTNRDAKTMRFQYTNLPAGRYMLIILMTVRPFVSLV